MFRLSRFFSYYFETGVSCLVGAGKKKGEDAYYATNDILSVADGVGGWIEYKVDPSLYAWELIRNIEKEEKSAKVRSAFEILSSSANKCKEKGSSTCVLMVLDQSSGLVDTINVGDSGFFVYRKNKEILEMVIKSKDVIQSFNVPNQLGTYGNEVSTGDQKKIQLQKEDLIIMYSDGLTDNLFEDHIKTLLEKSVSDGENLTGISKKLADTAFQFSTDEKYQSPFAKASGWHNGGKPDDITVVVAKVHEKA